MATSDRTSTWVLEPSGSDFSIRIDLAVVDGIGSEVLSGMGAVPRRGAEVGGLLLGRLDTGDRTTVYVDGYETVPCEYESGPFYVPSVYDLRRFCGAAERHDGNRRVVGMFRSHTRADKLELSDSDVMLLDRCASTDPSIALLIRPAALEAATAAVFLRAAKNQETKPFGMAFPFRRREMGGVGVTDSATPAGWRADHRTYDRQQKSNNSSALYETKPISSAPPKPPAPITAPMFGAYGAAVAPGTPVMKSRRWPAILSWTALLLAILAFGVAAGWVAGLRTGAAVRDNEDPYSLGLSVQAQGPAMLVRWDRDSKAVHRAWRGTLTITDDAGTKVIELDSAQVRHGTLLYTHAGREMRFQLDVYVTEQRRVTELLTVGAPAARQP